MAFNSTEDSRYPKPTRKLRLGFVGGGRGGLVGEWHAAGVRLSGRWDIVAGALSTNPENAKASGKDWLIPEDRIYTSLHDMAEKESKRPDGIEAVVICTPNFNHHEAAKAFLNKGIDVILDKPMTNTMADALDLLQLTRKNKLFLGMTYPYTFHAMVRQARHMIMSGAIGDVRQVLVEYPQEWGTAPDDPSFKGAIWRRDPARVGRTSATGDIGTHAFHLMNFVTGQPITKVRAEFHNCGAPKQMEDTAFMNVRLANGAPGSIWITQAAPGNYCRLTIRVFGLKGGIEWNQEHPEHLRVNYLDQPEQTIVRGHGAGVLPSVQRLIHLPRGHGETMTDAWGNMYTEFALAVEARRNGKTLPKDYIEISTPEDGVRGVKFIDACADSNEQGNSWQDCWIDP
jgi:predicted dehydrogenase